MIGSQRQRGWRGATLLGTASAMALSGCAVGPDFHRPAAPATKTYTETPLPAATDKVEGTAQHFSVGADVAGAWWGLFRSPELSGLIVTALKQNPSLEAARQTLRQAQETALADAGSWFPSIGGSLNRTRQKIAPAQGGLAGTYVGFPSTYTVYTAQLTVSYTFDVWGQTARTVEAAEAQADYQRFQLEAATNMLAANTAVAAINAAALAAEIIEEEKLIEAEQQILQVVQRQFEAGGATGTDIATQEAQLASTQALLVPLQTQLVQARDQLAAYLGRAPSEAGLASLSLTQLTLPADVPVSLPSQLVAQRPDIRASEAQLHTASAQLGIAIANRLPQITLSGLVGSAPAKFGDLFTPGNGIWALTNQLAGPIFEGGTLLHQQRAAAAALRGAAANYRNTVVTAFQNVADVLTALVDDARLVEADQAGLDASSRALSIAQLQYRNGGIAYLNVLASQTQYQNAVVALIRARAARLTDTVALFTALGGGWWNRDDVPPPPPGLIRSLFL